MVKIAVLGNAGGGKSTLCQSLSVAKSLPLYQLDKLLWNPGWVPTPKEKFDYQHDQILKLDKWIIDGMASLQSIERRLAEADTIIFIDLPLRIHYWWAVKRQFKSLFRARHDFVTGCPMFPKSWALIKMMWHIHYRFRPRILDIIKTYSDNKVIYHIQSARQLNRFRAEQCG